MYFSSLCIFTLNSFFNHLILYAQLHKVPLLLHHLNQKIIKNKIKEGI
jgi:hypothetical protein